MFVYLYQRGIRKEKPVLINQTELLFNIPNPDERSS